jgi:UV excision repair protein RAD23
MGAERQAQIAEMESMGFERSQIELAMRAAFYNQERAIEYLCTVWQTSHLDTLR